MKKLLFALFWLPALQGMQASGMQASGMQLTTSNPGSPSSPKKLLSPKDMATVVASKLFDNPDQEVISAFTKIITRDPKVNLALLEMRYRVLHKLEEEQCMSYETR